MENKFFIDWVDLESEQLMVRDTNLCHLVDNYSYLESVYYLITGVFPGKDILCEFDALLLGLAGCIFDYMEREYIRSYLDASFEQRIIAILSLVPLGDIYEYLPAIKKIFPLMNDADMILGIYLFASLPIVVAYLHSYEFMVQIKDLMRKNNYSPGFLAGCRDPGCVDVKHPSPCDLDLDPRLCGDMLLARAVDMRGWGVATEINSYMDLILMSFSFGKKHYESYRLIADKLLISLYAGFGVVTPTITLPRISAGTNASVRFGIIAAFTGCGPSHVGACKEMMIFLDKVSRVDLSDIKRTMRANIAGGSKISGFGHPLLFVDPRVSCLSKYAKEIFPNSIYLNIFMEMCCLMENEYGLLPNVDAISATILSEIGVDKMLGAIFFLYARMPAIIAHVLEKKSRSAFGLKRSEARERFDRFPFNWI